MAATQQTMAARAALARTRTPEGNDGSDRVSFVRISLG
jgi:hypothetical protein